MNNSLRVLIVDDTITYRMVLREVVKSMPGNHTIESVTNGQLALDKLQSEHYDVILLDVQMPVMNGLETLKVVRQKYPNIGVIMVSSIDKESSNITIQALELGAVDFISKPDEGSPQQNLTVLRDKLIPLFNTIASNRDARGSSAPQRPVQRMPQRPLAQPAANAPQHTTANTMILPGQQGGGRQDRKSVMPPRILAIAVSTGGPKALTEVIPNLPKNLPVPVVVVQHMPPMFTASLAESLNSKSAVTVKEAKEGEAIMPGTVYIAPGGIHMAIKRQGQSVVTTLLDTPPENSCKPAADVLFRSVSDVYKRHIVSLVMTGMGNDGALGVQYMKKNGHTYCISQTSDTCVVYGMPRAVDEMGLTDEHVPLNDIAGVVTEICCPAVMAR